VSLPGELHDVLSGQALSGAAVLPPKEVWILA
jgi:hypothetical protein